MCSVPLDSLVVLYNLKNFFLIQSNLLHTNKIDVVNGMPIVVLM